ncbi:MAG: DUF952 domain-containing protein [Cyanobacteria bacterium P01_A01_bin.17]
MPNSYIYHLASVSELQSGLTEVSYTPQRFALDGFVHCAETPSTTVAVANDYFSSLNEPLAVLEIDPLRLTVPLKFEAPAPLPGGDAHLKMAALFPHVYGPIDIGAIQSAALLLRTNGQYEWPSDFLPLPNFMEQHGTTE